MQRAFPPKVVVAEKKKTQSAAAASITVCRPQSKVDYIIYVLKHWQVLSQFTSSILVMKWIGW
jgi:hypothetical protein